MKSFLLKTILLIISLTLLSETSRACSCGEIPSVSSSFNQSFTVFSGKAISSRIVERPQNENERAGDEAEFAIKEKVFKFQVVEIFKGQLTKKTVDINVGSINGNCYRPFSIGESYLVYADGNDEKSLYDEFYCGITTNLTDAQSQIYFIREFLKEKSNPQIYGSVSVTEIDKSTGEDTYVLKSGYKVILEGNKGNFEEVTDEKGLYRFKNIPSGKYKIKIKFDDKYLSYYFSDDPIFILPNGRVVTQSSEVDVLSMSSQSDIERVLPQYSDPVYDAKTFDLHLFWKGRVSGKVLDAEGKVIKYASVNLLPIKFPSREIKVDLDNKLNDGEYACVGKPSGQYLLAVQINAPFKNKENSRFFYPQTKFPAKAQIISLNEKSNFTYNVSVPVIVRQIKGKVFWDDGTLMNSEEVADWGGRIFLTKYKSTKTPELFDFGFPDIYDEFDFRDLDDDSFFTLEGFEGAVYWVQFNIPVPVKVNGVTKIIIVKAKPVRIRIEKTNEPVKIIVPKPDNLVNSN